MIYIDEKETRRFGAVMARVPLFDKRHWDEILSFAREHKVEMMTLRCDADDMASVHFLEARGAKLMDSLIRYRHDTAFSLPEFVKEPSIELARAEDKARIEETAYASFTDFMSHYHADERIDNKHAGAGYAEWAGSFLVEESDENRKIFKAVLEGEIVGFAAITRKNDVTGEGSLYAVCPHARMQGIYKKLLAYSLKGVKDWGCQEMLIATQLNNYVVQKVWSAYGFYHYKSEYSFHLWLDELRD